METAFTACAPAASLLSQSVPSVASLLSQPRAAQPLLKKTTFHSECDFQSEFLPRRSFSAKTSTAMVSNGTDDIVGLSSYNYDPMYNGATDEVAWWRHNVRNRYPPRYHGGGYGGHPGAYGGHPGHFGSYGGHRGGYQRSYSHYDLWNRNEDYAYYGDPYRSYVNDAYYDGGIGEADYGHPNLPNLEHERRRPWAAGGRDVYLGLPYRGHSRVW
mmetsp:Transcript_38598/g.62534  ORF Transcript_38598/g.62534 Transcript_38598/m.62534 type:complete len:214 (-) Transcript_38598:231-872(-)